MNPNQIFGLASAIFASSLTVLAPSTARAADTVAPKTTLFDLALEGNRFINAAMSGNAPSGREAAEATNANPTAATAQPMPLVDFLPRASLVARDWRGSMNVAGRSMLLDDLRPAASQRMVLARIASDARLSPYAQVGAGEWRIDTALFPQSPTRQALAGSIGAGLELRTNAGFQVAGETNYTVFYRDGLAGQDDPGASLLTVLFAAKTRW